ncbi:MAG: PH domain-containing protein [Acidobacteriota bacterium]|nr:PH domain-containing protein [Acidobacteriota bacterium]
MGYADKSLAPGETVLYRARYHWVFYRSGLVVLLLAALLGAACLYSSRTAPGSGVAQPVGYLALAFAVLAAMLLAARSIRARNDEFVVTDRRVLRSVGLLSKEHEQAPIEKIQDITVTQGLVGRILGYGDVSLETAAERGTLVFPMIAEPEAFRTAIWGRPRADAASAAPAAPTSVPASAGTATAATAARLEELENLRRKGMVSESEYAGKRREILSGL